MVKINLGKFETERAIVDDDSYEAKVVGVSDVYEAMDYNGKSVEKIRFDFELLSGEKIPYFVSAVISDASEHNAKYKNSKLYDIMVQADALDDFQTVCGETFTEDQDAAQQNAVFVDFLRSILVNRRVKVLTKAVNPKSGDPYSVVDSVLKFHPKEEQ